MLVYHVRISDDTMTERTFVFTNEREAFAACANATRWGFKVHVNVAVRIKEGSRV